MRIFLCSVADLLLSNKPLLNKLTSFITMVRDTLYSERGNDKRELCIILLCHCVCTLFVHAGECCWWEAVCSCVTIELVGSLVESYQHGLSDVSSRLYLYSS